MFGKTLSGAVAQLGERLLCKQDVVGSIPSGSTNARSRRDRRFSRPLARLAKRDPQDRRNRDDLADHALVSSRGEKSHSIKSLR